MTAKPNDPAAPDATSENVRTSARKPLEPNEPTAVVGLGASAGGITPLQQFFADMPAESGLAFVVVMHLSPEHESNLAAVLQQKTAMPVTQVTSPIRVRSNHVYVIPPNNQLMFEHGQLQLTQPQRTPGRRVTIDLFFRTLAQAYGQRAVSIIFSGSDSDGAIGLKHVRAQGGVTIAQDPKEAEFESMPVTAISTGMVDWVLPVSEMPARLVAFVENERRMRLPPEIAGAEEPHLKDKDAPGGETISEETHDSEDEEALGKVLADLRAQTGHDFAQYKRATVLRRIARRLQVNSLESIPQYLDFLREHPAEGRALLQDLLIGVTHFFRDREAFAALEAHIPQLFAGKKPDDQIRVWVAGCATGEEAYSIAILLCEHAERIDQPPKIQVFASDVDEQAIADARDGLYPSTIEADVSPQRLCTFFTLDQGRYRVRKEIREKVFFADHNVLKDAPFSRLDLVSCRNLLIYLNTTAQKQVFDIFHFTLVSGGLLFIGGAESDSAANALFSTIDLRNRLYIRRSVPRPGWRISLATLSAEKAAAPTLRRPASRALPRLGPIKTGQTKEEIAAAIQSSQARRQAFFGELHLKLLEQYGPPSLVINDGHDIVHLSEHAGRYLQFPAGESTANLLKVVHPQLRIELRSALFKAAQSQETIRGTPQSVEIEGETEAITISVCPFRQDRAEGDFFLILFERVTGLTGAPPGPVERQPIDLDLDAEIHHLKEQLNQTVEEYEATNEELKASNEELQAVNEEMHSATEELETSREELQSVNEELTTVNQELKNSVEDLSRANADLNNLMASTDIGTVFLDRELRIQRFTPSAQKIFNLIPADMGRPLSDITHQLAHENFLEDAELVLRDLRTIEREVRVGDVNWYLTRIAPYRTAEDRIAGVVATFIDITRRKQAEDALRESESRLRRALDIETVGVLFLNVDGQIKDANNAFLRMSGYSREDLENGLLRWGEFSPPEWRPLSISAFEELKGTGKTGTYQKEYVRKDGTRWWGLFSAAKLSQNLAVKYVLDINEQKQAEEALRASEERFRQFAENSTDVLWMFDAEKERIDYVSAAFERVWGEPPERILGKPEAWAATLHPDDRKEGMERLGRLRKGETVVSEYRIIRPSDGAIRWIRDTGFPVVEKAGRILRMAGLAQDVTEEKIRSEALAESEERFRLLVDGAPDYAMLMLDPGNQIIYWSAGAERVFGWSAEEALGKSGELIFTPEDRARKQEQKEMRIALREGVADDRRWLLRKDGSRVWIDGIMRRLDDELGNHRGFAKIGRDATEQHLAEQNLQESHRDLETRVSERTAQLMALNQQLQSEMNQRVEVEQELLLISEREKRRIGQDLHDSLCQELAAAALFLQTAAHKLKPDTASGAKVLSEAARIVNDNVGLARDLARGLHPVELSSQGLANALRELAFRTSQIRSVTCQFECPRQIRIGDEAIALNLYRIAQEAVTNARKNGKATAITIKLLRQGKDLSLTIEDNGRGFSPSKPQRGMGLHIMKYRAGVIGAKLTLTSAGGKGTLVNCLLPGDQSTTGDRLGAPATADPDPGD
ncbi:MAG: PAS domain S-box protein [Chthoniobacterales bacterium]|nr:PAS domain S-box protein [Chthoniobacterales bacterium]